MSNGYIGIIDSGAGGLFVLKALAKKMPKERFVYFGDNDNVPYGNKSKRELLSLANKSLSEFYDYNLKCVVLGCNTLSVSVLNELKNISPVPVFGVFPPVEKALLKYGSATLIATKRTCEKYRGIKNLCVLSMKDLACEIEKNKFSVRKTDLKKFLPVATAKTDCVILGCTHYEFLKEEIAERLKAKTVISGISDCAEKVFKELQKSKIPADDLSVKFIGKSAKENAAVWEMVVKK